MAFKKYQVSFNEDGTIASTIQLPPEPSKKRVITVRAETSTAARSVAKTLYSMAE